MPERDDQHMPPLPPGRLNDDRLRRWLRDQTIHFGQILGGEDTSLNLNLPEGFFIRVFSDTPSTGEDSLFISPEAQDGVDHIIIGPTGSTNFLKRFRARADRFQVEGDGQTRFQIGSNADGGDVLVNDPNGNSILLWDESDDAWIIGNGKRLTINRDSGAASVNIDSDGDNARVRMWAGAGTDPVGDNRARLVLDSATNDIYLLDGDITADDGSTGQVEIFPKGTLIDMGNNTSETDISNISSSETNLTASNTTISCDYASQPVYVDVTITVHWAATSDNQLYRIRPGVNGTAQGMQTAMRYQDTLSGGDGVDVAGTSTTTNPSATTTTDSAHNHSVLNDDHSHGSGTYSVNGNHTHANAWTNLPDSIRWCGQATTNGSGNIVLSIFGQGDNAADISAWQIAYSVWRR